MQKSKHFFFVLLIMAIAINTIQAQVDISSMGFSYSALIRDTAGHVQPNKQVQLQFSILPTNTAITPIYTETQLDTTDAFGFANTTIGKTNPTAFAAVDFTASNYWVLIQVYNTFTRTYDIVAKQPLQAVPYAKVAYKSIYGGVPTGTIVAYGGDNSGTPPDGWWWCDASTQSITDPKFANLFKVIGTFWGGPSPTTFQIPDLRGEFLRAADLGKGNDPDAATTRNLFPGASLASSKVGTWQADEFASHTHNARITSDYIFPFQQGGMGIQANDGQQVQFQNTNKLQVQVDATGGSETRPKNVYVNYIIKL